MPAHEVLEDGASAALDEADLRQALGRAGLGPDDLEAIIFATLSPDHYFPGNGVFLGRELGLDGIPCLDVRNQCTGFLYGLSIADAWIRAGVYRRIALVGSEIQSTGLNRSAEVRDVTVLFGDGAGVAILEAHSVDGESRARRTIRGVLRVVLHADGRRAGSGARGSRRRRALRRRHRSARPSPGESENL